VGGRTFPALTSSQHISTELLEIAQAALDAVGASALVRRAVAAPDLPLDRERPLSLVAAGKASAAMVAAWYAASDLHPSEAVAVGTHDGERVPPDVDWYTGGHPTPTRASVDAAGATLGVASRVPPDGQLVVLLSGGASALLSLPADGLTLEDKQQTTRALMHDGRAIDEVNCVRKHLSAIKGGRLVAACRGRVVTLAISDVVAPVEDDPSVIGSGPTVPDPSTYADALAIVVAVRDRGAIPEAVRTLLERGARGELAETPKPGDPAFAGATYRLIGTRRTAMDGAIAHASANGYATVRIDQPMIGEARDAGRAFVRQVVSVTEGMTGPVCVVASGETTVTVTGGGRGGRNQEFVAGAIEVLGTTSRPIALCSVGTDGIDGPTDAAGAWADGSTAAAAADAGLDIAAYLADNNAYALHDALGTLIRTGRTDTNVGDVQIAIVG
jgi:glycerate 2-kinase